MDFNKIKDPAIAKRVWEEGAELVSHCHFGVQGLTKTEEDVKKRCTVFWIPALNPLHLIQSQPL